MAQDFDSPWKEALERFLEAFLAFFVPKAHVDIDWSYPAEHLDSELRKVVRDAAHPNRRADHLVKVRRLSGEPRLILIHVEVQSQVDESLGKRMFTTLYRVFDRFDLPVVGLAVLGAERRGWDPSRFGWDIWDMGVEARFRTVQLLDYNRRWAELEQDPNPFSLVVQAYLKTLATRHQAVERRNWKLRLIRRLYERRYSREDVLELFRLIDWMMDLPQAEMELFQKDLAALEEELSMPYVTSVERMAEARGLKQGLERGLEQGLERGLGFLGGVLKRQLKVRFGEVPSWVDERLSAAGAPDLERWGESLLTAESIEDVFGSEA